MQKSFYFLFILVHILLLISFQSTLPFWIVFTVTFLLLIVAAIRFGEFASGNFLIRNLALAILSGLFMYGLFYVGKLGATFLFPAQLADVGDLYMKIKPVESWHYVALFLIIIPGEELFWRGYIQGKIETRIQNKLVVLIISALLYTSANIYTLNPLFLLATFAGGVVWGTLYIWKRNMLLTIISHLVFNLFFLVLFPLF